jgi:hypothetical protein
MNEKEVTQLNIRGIDLSVKRQFEHLKLDKHFNNGAGLLAELLNNYVLNEKLFNQQEQKIFDNALSIQNITAQELLKIAVIPFCNRIIKNNKNGKVEHTKTLEANNKLDEIIKSIMLHNDNVELKEHKIYINQTALLKYVKENPIYSKTNNEQIKTFNVQVIKRYLAKNKDLLNQHHTKHDLKETHNRDIANFRKTKH